MHDQVGIVIWFASDYRCGQTFESVAGFSGSIGACANKGKIDLTFGEKRVDFTVCLSLHQLDVVSCLGSNMIEQCLVVAEGLSR